MCGLIFPMSTALLVIPLVINLITYSKPRLRF
jgi:hypothetical protein